MANATNDTNLRAAIQNASSLDPVVGLTGAGQVYSVLTLGKRSSVVPAPVAYDGYSVQGSTATLASSQELRNTRIYQQNVDSAYAPGLVKDLTLNYISGGAADNGALLSMTSTGSRSLTLDNLLLTGVHKGWTGNGNLYMSLRSFNALKPLATTFTLSGSSIDIKGQNNSFQLTSGVGSGGSAFIHNWNNNAVFTLTNNIFDESGYLSSFNLLNYSAVHGSAVISGNTFKRTDAAKANVRWEGNRLQNVDATLTNNTFQDGSYVDLYGSIGSITLASNTFNTIAGGYGIRVTDLVTGTPAFLGTNTFSGGGLALKFVKSTSGFITVTGTFSVNGFTFAGLKAGGQAADTITGTPGNNWVSGDLGNDSLTGGAGNDAFVFATALNATSNLDTVTDFTNTGGQTDKIFLAQSIFTGLSTGTLAAGSFATAAATGKDIVYSSGGLYFKQGGDASLSNYTQFATLTGSPSLSNTDFVVF